LSENLKGRDHSVGLGAEWEHNIRMDLCETGWEAVNWMHVVPDKDQWRVLMNTAMNLRGP